MSNTNWFGKLFNRNRGGEIDFGDILLDGKNLPQFKTENLEGEMVQPISRKAFSTVLFIFIVLVGISAMRLFSLQVVNGQEYSTRAENNRLSKTVIFNKRGIISDRNGTELAWNAFTDNRDFPLRRYIDTPGFAHMLGYVTYPQQDSRGNYFSTEYKGVSGLEYAYSDRLNGQLGQELREVDSLGRTISSYATQKPVPGENITLSIDSGIQAIMGEELARYVDELGFVGAAGGIMDVRTGELIAMTSVPEYDNNILSDGSDRTTIASYNTDQTLPFLNRMVGGTFAPGSIVKVFIGAGLMNEDIVDPNYRLFTDGTLEVPNTFGRGFTVFRDARNNGIVDFFSATARSSNIYFMTFGGGFGPHRGLGIQGMKKYLNMFGLGEKTGIKEFNELSGVVPSPEWKDKTFGEKWVLGDTYFTAIGQYGFLSTPMQALVAVSALANDGRVLVPQLAKNAIPQVRREIPIGSSDMQLVRDAMRQTVLAGTTRSLNLPFVEVASKSGTAERGVRRSQVNSWTIGFWPYQDPKYSFVVMAEQGPRSYPYSVSRVMTRVLNRMNEEGLAEEYFEKKVSGTVPPAEN